jgi:hypothetical protein
MTKALQCKHCWSMVILPFDEPDLNGNYFFCNRSCYTAHVKLTKVTVNLPKKVKK